MKVTFELDTEEPQQSDEVQQITKSLNTRIALWDIDKMLRSMLKYEDQVHDGYLTEEEEAVVEYMQKKFLEILDEQDITKLVLGMP